MRILVLGGAGYIGSQAVRDLVETSDFTQITIGDIDLPKAEALVRRLGDDRLSAVKVDVKDEASLINLISEFDIVASTLPWTYDPLITRACIKAGVNGLDVDTEETQFDYDAEAREAGVLYVPGVGATPGITNVLAKYGAEQLDSVESIRIAFAAFRCVAPAPGLLYTTIWEVDPTVKERAYYEDGRLVPVPPLSGEMVVKFLEPIGSQKVYYVPHSETYTLPKYIPGVRRVEVRGTWPPEVIELLRVLLNFGFLSEKPINIKGVDISPKEFVYEHLSRVPEAKKTEVWGYGLHVEVSGLKDGMNVCCVLRVGQPLGQGWEGPIAYPRFVGTPLSIGVQMMAKGLIKGVGVLPPEACIPTKPFLDELAKRGYRIEERLIGYRTIRQP